MPPIRIKRVYETAEKSDGFRVLVDRVWPRGLTKAEAAVERLAKELAPSTALRRWFGHEPAKWPEFQARYRRELDQRADALRGLLADAGKRPITLLFGARDVAHNQAVVLRQVLSELDAGA
jgi:uncharacterized protein YeaO (DUF488 family)